MFLASCTQIDPLFKIRDICTPFDDLPFVDVTAPAPQVAFEIQGQIIVMHGFGSAKLDSGRREIKVAQSVSVPDYANHATVFLNGWKLGYLGGEVDHHVSELGALITKITFDQERRSLTWNAAGALSDLPFEEGYSFTYHYTLIAWNDAVLNVRVDHSDCESAANFPNNTFMVFNEGDTALLSFSSFTQNRNFVGRTVVLPRGFGFNWGGDHHLLQVAYNLDHSEIFAEGDKNYIRNKLGQRLRDTPIGEFAPLPKNTRRVDSGFVSWDTFAIFKDDGRHIDYIFAERVSILSGNEVGLIQPPFVINPQESAAGEFGGPGARIEQFVIENIPFEGAIPMLTGWELSYAGNDHHVKDVGIWIDQWNYTPSPSGGTLRYTLGSTLTDKDHMPDYFHRHRITVLGIRPIAGSPLR